MDKEEFDALSLIERREFWNRELKRLRSDSYNGKQACLVNLSAWMKEKIGYHENNENTIGREPGK